MQDVKSVSWFGWAQRTVRLEILGKINNSLQQSSSSSFMRWTRISHDLSAFSFGIGTPVKIALTHRFDLVNCCDKPPLLIAADALLLMEEMLSGMAICQGQEGREKDHFEHSMQRFQSTHHLVNSTQNKAICIILLYYIYNHNCTCAETCLNKNVYLDTLGVHQKLHRTSSNDFGTWGALCVLRVGGLKSLITLRVALDVATLQDVAGEWDGKVQDSFSTMAFCNCNAVKNQNSKNQRFAFLRLKHTAFRSTGGWRRNRHFLASQAPWPLHHISHNFYHHLQTSRS